MEKWKGEIEDILGKAEEEMPQDWEELLKELLPLMGLVVTLSVAPIAVLSPEGRDKLREMLAEDGVPQDKIEQAIYWIIQNTTRPLGGDQCQGKQ